MFNKLYPVKDAEGDEEEKKDAGEKPKKKKKGISFAPSVNKKIKVIKQNRGGRKFSTTIFGLEEWGCDLTDTAQKMAKKFGTGAAACEIDYKEL